MEEIMEEYGHGKSQSHQRVLIWFRLFGDFFFFNCFLSVWFSMLLVTYRFLPVVDFREMVRLVELVLIETKS